MDILCLYLHGGGY